MYHKFKIMSQKSKIDQLRKGELVVPTCATLHLSYSCNQHCKSCAYAEYNKDHFIPKKEDVFKYVKELIDYGVKGFDISGGGDPTTLPYILDLLKYIISRDCNYGFVSNGWKMSKELMDYIGETATYIRISLETGDKDLYTKYKGVSGKVFEEVLQNIKYLSAYKKEDVELGLKFDVDKVLYGEKHITNSLAILEELGADLATFKAMSGESRLNRTELGWINGFLETSLRYDIIDVGKTKVINAILNHNPPPEKCWLMPLQVAVDGKGKVYLCCYYYGIPDMEIGDLNINTFIYIWESEEHINKYKKFNTKYCGNYDCRFFAHHAIIKEADIKGRLEIM